MYWTRNNFSIEIIYLKLQKLASRANKVVAYTYPKHEVCIEASSLFPFRSTMFSRPSSNCSRLSNLLANENLNLSLRTHISETYFDQQKPKLTNTQIRNKI